MTKYAFEKMGEISQLKGRPKFEFSKKSDDCDLVYLWTEITNQKYIIVYVGMTGKTLKARCHQHKRGFSGSTTGRQHSNRIINGINEGKNYEVYARKAGASEVLDENSISMASVEELAFIRKFNPPWNSPNPSLGTSPARQAK